MSPKRVADWSVCTESFRNACQLEAVIFPDAGELRAREVVSRSNSQSAGKYPSWKMQRMVHWESLNELNAFRLLDCDPRVWRFFEQPCRIVFTLDGAKKTHYPDVLLIGAEGKQLWEIKTRCKSIDPEVVRRTELLRKALPEHGFAYRLIVAEDLAKGPRLQNAKLLLQFGRRQVTLPDWEQIRRVLQVQGSLEWTRICRGDYGQRGRELVCSLVLRGVLSMDMDSVLTPATRFYSRKDGCDHGDLRFSARLDR